MKFFDKLPIISYNGVMARNLVSRAGLTDSTRENSSLFYPYTLDNSERIDTVSYKYYGDADYMWMIYLANDVVDPYYDVSISDYDFDRLIEKKYGSISNAAQQIAFWRNNWVQDDEDITISAYEALSAERKKYYNPVVDQYNIVQAYERKKVDWVYDTNMIVQTTISDVVGTFVLGERVRQKYDANTLYTANAVISYSNNSALTLKHVIGTDDILASNDSVTLTVTGIDSGATANVQTTSISIAIPDTEASFYSPVSYFQYEQELNDGNKTFDMIDRRYTTEIERELKRALT